MKRHIQRAVAGLVVAIAASGGLCAADKAQWKELSFEEIMNDTESVLLGTLGDEAGDAGEGWQKVPLDVEQTLYRPGGGMLRNMSIHTRSEDIPGEAVRHAPGKSGIWFLRLEGRRRTANHPQRYLPVSEKDVVIRKLKAWIAARIEAGIKAIPESVRNGQVFETEESRKAVRELLRDIDAERMMEWKKEEKPWSSGENPYVDRIQAIYDALGIDLGFPLAPKNETECRQIIGIVFKQLGGSRSPPEKGTKADKELLHMAPFLLTTLCREMIWGVSDTPKEIERIKKKIRDHPEGQKATLETRLDMLKFYVKMVREGIAMK